MLRTVRDACTIHPMVHDNRISQAIQNLSDLIKEEGNGEEFLARNYVTQGTLPDPAPRLSSLTTFG
jgi:hypothetical protein